MRTKQYVALLILAAVLGVVISFLVYWYLKLIAEIQTWVFTDLPKSLGFHGEPPWWPLLPLAVAGAIVGATIRYLPGRGGHSPADGFKAGGVAQSAELPGIFLAALAGLGLGAVIGPEAPLIALGGGLAVLAVKLARRDVPASTGAVIAAAGSFAAISTLFGNPLAAAFLLLEASGLGGPMATIVLIPGLLGAGIGYLIFLGLNAWTGYGTFSLAIPNLPAAAPLDVAQLGWAVAIGAAAAVVSFGIRWLALFLRPHVERRLVLLTPLVGLVIAGLAIAFAEGTGKPSSAVLFSGQTALTPLLEHAASYTVGALVLLVVCKGLAYSLSLCSFRGGPTFPAMFIGAAGVLGFALGERRDTGLAYGALVMGVAVRGGQVPGVIFHTDQGSEYTAAAFRARRASGWASASRWAGPGRRWITRSSNPGTPRWSPGCGGSSTTRPGRPPGPGSRPG